MKILALFLMLPFLAIAIFRARLRFKVALVPAVIALLAMNGCATERASPGSAATGDLCPSDGSYILTNCKRHFP